MSKGVEGSQKRFYFTKKKKEIASLIILRGYSHLTDRKFGMNYYRYIENEANVKKSCLPSEKKLRIKEILP